MGSLSPRFPSALPLAAVLLMSVLPGRAHAVLEPDGADDSQYMALGQAFEGQALSFRAIAPGFGTGVRNASAVFWNGSYAITSAHNIADLLQYNPSFEVATGDNFNTNRGTVVSVDQVLLYPVFPNDGNFYTPDIAILHLSQTLSGSAAVVASASVGDVLTSAGYGRHGTPSTGLPVADGAIRGWNAEVVMGTVPNVSPVYYQETGFADFYGTTLNGKGASGDSGGPVFDASGRLVGMNDAQWGGLGPLGGTDFLNLSQPEVRAWLNANTRPVPESAPLLALGVSAATLIVKRRKRSGSRT